MRFLRFLRRLHGSSDGFKISLRHLEAMEPDLLDWVELRLRRERELINEALATQHLQLMAELRTRRREGDPRKKRHSKGHTLYWLH